MNADDTKLAVAHTSSDAAEQKVADLKADIEANRGLSTSLAFTPVLTLVCELSLPGGSLPSGRNC
jgi:hypothetical protein